MNYFIIESLFEKQGINKRKEILKKVKSIVTRAGFASSACFGAAIGAGLAINPVYGAIALAADGAITYFYYNGLKYLETKSEGLRLEEGLVNYT